MKSVEHYAERLRARRNELQRRLVAIEQDLDAPVPNDWDDQAIEREGNEVMEGIGAAGLAEIRAIEAALKRVEDGTFGICVACGDPISEERLDAVPYAPRCRNCAR
ncbi:MAG TPA: TraR/DksA family transcriptional regulator [Paracoccaceae bacterium]|nr:TraR/DksA family transcriptional regulator [Paracoccaceae bacterium]